MKQLSENPYIYFRHLVEVHNRKNIKHSTERELLVQSMLYVFGSVLKWQKCKHFTHESEMFPFEMVLFRVNQGNTIQAAEVTLSFLNQPQGPALLTAEAETVCWMGPQ